MFVLNHFDTLCDFMLLIRSSWVASEASTRLYVDIGEQFGRVHGLKLASRLAMLSRIEGEGHAGF